PELLQLFATYDIHATWATVGMLLYRNAAAVAAALPPPPLRPQYTNSALSSYRHFENYVRPQADKQDYYFAPDLVQKIIDAPGQELASHTFSHYYCLESQRGENGEAIFAAD